MAIKPTNLFDAHRKLANERALLLKLGHAFRIAFKVNLYVSADTESILFKDDNPQSSQFVDFNKQNIYPLLKKAEHCRGYSAILNFLWDIQRDPFCEKLITGYHIGSDKTGYIQICSLQDFISQVKKLQIETLNDQNHDNNSRCLIS